jgi:hypothetical protein
MTYVGKVGEVVLPRTSCYILSRCGRILLQSIAAIGKDKFNTLEIRIGYVCMGVTTQKERSFLNP